MNKSFSSLFGLCLTYLLTISSVQLKIINNKPFYKVMPEKVNMLDAVKLCDEKGMSLAVIKSGSNENDLEVALKLVADKYPENVGTQKGFWISGARLEPSNNNSKFIWHSDGTFVTYTNWGKDEPNNEEGLEDCMEIYKDDESEKYLWNDVPCDAEKPFICFLPYTPM